MIHDMCFCIRAYVMCFRVCGVCICVSVYVQGMFGCVCDMSTHVRVCAVCTFMCVVAACMCVCNMCDVCVFVHTHTVPLLVCILTDPGQTQTMVLLNTEVQSSILTELNYF